MNSSGLIILGQIIFNPFSSTATHQYVSRNSSVPDLPMDLRTWHKQQEAQLITVSLQQAHYRQPEAALLLGLSYHPLRALLKKHQIKVG